MLSCKGFMCRQCFDALYPKDLHIIYDTPHEGYVQRSAICRCSNLAIIWDEDVTPRLYVHDITTVQPLLLLLKDNYEEVRRVLLKPITSAIYTDIKPLKDTSLTYQHLAKKNKYERKTSTKYNQKLIDALDRYNNTTSDGEEVFLRTTRNDPKKES